MTPNQPYIAIESLESFCTRISQDLSGDGFDVTIRPGDHLIDDTGSDSLTVLTYISQLQSLGLQIDMGEFDTRLLNIDFAYQEWLKTIAANPLTTYQGEFS